MQSVRQIKVGKHFTGIVGLDTVLEEVAGKVPQASDKAIAAEMIHRLSQKNYIPSCAYGNYEAALIRDMETIAGYGVMGSPALVINGKVKAVGNVPSKSRLRELILDAGATLLKGV